MRRFPGPVEVVFEVRHLSDLPPDAGTGVLVFTTILILFLLAIPTPAHGAALRADARNPQIRTGPGFVTLDRPAPGPTAGGSTNAGQIGG